MNFEKHVLFFPASIVMFGKPLVITGQVHFSYNEEHNRLVIDSLGVIFEGSLIELPQFSDIPFIQDRIWGSKKYWDIEDYWWYSLDNVVDLEVTINDKRD